MVREVSYMPGAVTAEACMSGFQQWCLGFTEELVELLSLSGEEPGDDFRAGQCIQLPEHALCPAYEVEGSIVA